MPPKKVSGPVPDATKGRAALKAIKEKRGTAKTNNFLHLMSSVAVAALLGLVAVGAGWFNGTSKRPKSSGGSSTTTTTKTLGLRHLTHYGLGPGAPPFPDVVALPCPDKGRNGSALDCFFEDLMAADVEGDVYADFTLGSQGVYGEITPTGVSKLLKFVGTDENDGFVDLGSGVGKVVLQAFLTTNCRHVMGVELSERRHQAAHAAGKRMLDGLSLTEAQKGRLDFRFGDATEADIHDMTIIFMCSLCFPEPVMQRLEQRLGAAAAPGTVILTLKPFDGCHAGLTLIGHIPLPMTWTARFEMLLYVVSPPLSALLSLVGPSFGEYTWRKMARASVNQSHLASVTAALEKPQLDGELISSVLERLAPGIWPGQVVQRFLRLSMARVSGAEVGQMNLALDRQAKDRCREMDVDATSSPTVSMPAEDFAHYLLARARGDESSVIQCMILSLWPRTFPKLPPEEQKVAFGHAAPQAQMHPIALDEVLNLPDPPLGPEDVLLEVMSGPGYFMLQAVLTTNVGRAVGMEIAPTRHKSAVDAITQLAQCRDSAAGMKQAKIKDKDQRDCPVAVQMIPPKEALEGQFEAMNKHAMNDGIDATATVVIALTQGWPRGVGGMWSLAGQTASELQPGAVVIVTSAWPGCRRGLFEVFSLEMQAPKDGRIRFPMTGSALVSLVTPALDAADPISSSAEDPTNALRSQVLEILGKQRGTTIPNNEWRKTLLSRAEFDSVLLSLGPPFRKIERVQLGDRLWRLLKKADRRSLDSKVPETEDTMSVWRLVSFLKVGILGQANTPLECVAHDLQSLARDERSILAKTKVSYKEMKEAKNSKDTKTGAPERSEIVERGSLKVPTLAVILEHVELRSKLTKGSTVFVLGDCQAALLSLFALPGLREVRCDWLAPEKTAAVASTDLEDAFKGLSRFFPGKIEGKLVLPKQRVDGSFQSWSDTESWKDVDIALIFLKQIPGEALRTRLATELPKLATGRLIGCVAADLCDLLPGKQASSLKLPRGWEIGKEIPNLELNVHQLP